MNFKKYFNFEKGSITYGLTNELIAFFVKELFNQEELAWITETQKPGSTFCRQYYFWVSSWSILW